MINVTKTFLPPIEDYKAQLHRIWDNQWLTNNGEPYQELSAKFKENLGVRHLIPNGTKSYAYFFVLENIKKLISKYKNK